MAHDLDRDGALSGRDRRLEDVAHRAGAVHRAHDVPTDRGADVDVVVDRRGRAVRADRRGDRRATALAAVDVRFDVIEADRRQRALDVPRDVLGR